jgi:hypothetical protein
MPRYEIVAHVVRELDCDTAEDAASVFRRQLLAEARREDALVHRAVWRDEANPTASAVLLTVRQKLAEFFAAVERGAEDAEAAFRDRVEAILIGPADPDVTDGGPRPGPSPAGRQCVVPPDD